MVQGYFLVGDSSFAVHSCLAGDGVFPESPSINLATMLVGFH